MTAAIFGLIGVLIGGVLNGVVSWLIELSRQRDAARASARLLSHELQGNRRVLDDAIGLVSGEIKNPEAAADRLGELSQSQWAEHRSTLARGLRAEDFDVISRAYVNLYEINAAATRLRQLAATARIDEKGKTADARSDIGNMVTDAANAVLPGLGELLSAAPAIWKMSRDWLREAIATSELESARVRTQAALDIAESAAEDSMMRRATQGRRRRRRPSDAQRQGPSGDTRPTGLPTELQKSLAAANAQAQPPSE
ncbi:MAG: hypothetical protein ACXVHB_31640 [Solirubrobacteraceae bacterium]